MSKRTGVLFIGFIVLSGAALAFLVQRNGNDAITNGNPTSNTSNRIDNTNTVTSDYTPVVSNDGSLTLQQPAETTVTGEIVTYRFLDGNSLSVMPEALQSVVLNETPVVQMETDWPVGGVMGEYYTLTSAKDGSEFYVVQVVVDSKLYDFRGSDAYLNHLGDYVTFNNI